MLHVIVKLWLGKTEQRKQRPTDAIVGDVASILDYGDESASIALEEISAQEWTRKVYEPDIEGKSGTLYKKPGYRM